MFFTVIHVYGGLQLTDHCYTYISSLKEGKAFLRTIRYKSNSTFRLHYIANPMLDEVIYRIYELGCMQKPSDID
jgi:hypothetical protein